MNEPWHARRVEWLRAVTDVVTDPTLIDWIRHTVANLEAERPVRDLNEVTIAAEHAVSAALRRGRVFRETSHGTSARWYALPDGRTYISRCAGHLERSRHSLHQLETALELEEEATE